MKRSLFMYLFLCCTLGYGQRFQVTTGTGLHEDTWAVIDDNAIGRFVTIGNANNSDNLGRLWIASYSSSGNMITSAISSTGKRLIVRDICKAPDDPTNAAFPTTYYVTGWTINSNNISQMFAGRINLTASFLWYRESPGPTVAPFSEEGVAVATAPNGDLVATGNVIIPTQIGSVPAGMRVKMARFNSAGTVLWTNVYNTEGNWKVREIANGTAVPNCAPSPTSTPGEFIITGEVSTANSAGTQVTRTFAAVYNGAGVECWKNVYPSVIAGSNITQDGGYDVMLNSSGTTAGNYIIAGVAQYGGSRGSTTCTPYFVEVTTSGTLVKGAVYTNPNNGPLGIYPRCITRGTNSGAIACAGPSFGNNTTAFITIPTVGGAATIHSFNGIATANSVASGLVGFNDAYPEGILLTTRNSKPGFVISTNANPGAFGNTDGHLIRTDINGKTPDSCGVIPVASVSFTAGSQTTSTSSLIQASWSELTATNQSYAVQQRFCKDTCVVSATHTYVITNQAVDFTTTGNGNGLVTYAWNFGDGSTSAAQNPTHNYANPGPYVTCLTVTNVNASGDTCRATKCDTIKIGCSLKAGFRDSLVCGKKYIMINSSTTSSSVTTYVWYVNGVQVSTDQSPTIIFPKCSTNVVKLKVCNANCCDSLIKEIRVACCNLKAEFCLVDSGRVVTLSYTKGANPTGSTYTIYLDGTPVTWTNGGKKTLTVGVHTICVKVSKAQCPGDTCCAICCKTIRISEPCILVANFWYTLQGDSVTFINKTTPSGYVSMWNFGDGSPTVTAANTGHHYGASGTYTVCLYSMIIKGNDTLCTSRTCRSIVIESPCYTVIPKFSAKRCSATPLSIDFINTTVAGTRVVSYSWQFGDGTGSQDVSPSHTYLNPGNYTVCVTVYNGNLCAYKACYSVIVSSTSCDTSCTQLPPNPVYGPSGSRETVSVTPIAFESIEKGVVTDRTAEMKKSLPAEEPVKDKLTLFPNPATQQVQVVYETSAHTAAEITIVNAMGAVMYKKAIPVGEGRNQYLVPLQSLSAGNYFLRLQAADRSQVTMFTVNK